MRSIKCTLSTNNSGSEECTILSQAKVNAFLL